MRKKLIALAMAAMMLGVAVIGGTLAYFTDTETKDNVFTTGNVDIALTEKGADGETFKDGQTLLPGSKTKNNIVKSVTVDNIGKNDAYCWIEVWVPSALDDGDDNSPKAPGKGNSLHFNYASNVVETKSTYLGTKAIDGVYYNGYVHYIANSTAVTSGMSTSALLDQVYMDSNVTQCTDNTHKTNCLVLQDGTHYTGPWDLVINAIGFQADGFNSVTDAISSYYGLEVTNYIW
jgi:alternate signal-mediated exported protein